MKITIVKSDAFETVGLTIGTDNKGYNAAVILQWGVPAADQYYTKTLNGDTYEVDIIDLVEANQQLLDANALFDRFNRAIEIGAISLEKGADGTYSKALVDFCDDHAAEARRRLDKKVERFIEKITNRK